MLYNCIWESSLRELLFSESSRRSQANTHQAKTFWKRLALHSRTRSNAFILLFMLFYWAHYAPLQHVPVQAKDVRTRLDREAIKMTNWHSKFSFILDASCLRMNMWNLNALAAWRENVTWSSHRAWLHVCTRRWRNDCTGAWNGSFSGEGSLLVQAGWLAWQVLADQVKHERIVWEEKKKKNQSQALKNKASGTVEPKEGLHPRNNKPIPRRLRTHVGSELLGIVQICPCLPLFVNE